MVNDYGPDDLRQRYYDHRQDKKVLDGGGTLIDRPQISGDLYLHE